MKIKQLSKLTLKAIMFFVIGFIIGEVLTLIFMIVIKSQ